MSAIKRGAAAIMATEAELKRLASDAVAASEWAAVATLASWAGALSALLERSPTGEKIEVAHPARAPVGGEADDRKRSGAVTKEVLDAPFIEDSSKQPSARPASSASKLEPRRKSPATTQRKATAKYPRFVHEGDALIKIGWSKKDKAEYEHRAPRKVIDDVVEAILGLGRDGSRFTVEQLLPLLATADGTGTPNYQTYLCVAWLRELNLLEQHGRQGYSVPRAPKLATLVSEAWDATPIRR